MILILNGHSYHYEMESLCDIFLPYEKVTVIYGTKEEAQAKEKEEEIVAYTGL